jgi:xylulose-5-phosphate/fructose-6-phosphate phosphoketolase
MVASGSAVSKLSSYGVARSTIEGAPPGSDGASMHQAMAATMDHCIRTIRGFQGDARSSGTAVRPRWPMIVLRTPKGWTAPLEVDERRIEGLWRAHQVPLSGVKKNPAHLELLEQWMRGYKPEDLFDDEGRPVTELRELAPTGNWRMGMNPHANGGLLKKHLLPRRCCGPSFPI